MDEALWQIEELIKTSERRTPLGDAILGIIHAATGAHSEHNCVPEWHLNNKGKPLDVSSECPNKVTKKRDGTISIRYAN